ncbi:MAG: hypothetical protein HY827_02000 [Actinobacteria bacterium]|nr:hypothetical protein [Actinomycetota bacterium]
MSKVGGALPAWYWPEGIPRRSPVPQQTLDRLIKRAGRDTSAPAIVWKDRAVSYGELLEKVTSYAQAVHGLLPDDEVVAIFERDPGDALILTLAVIQTGRRALLPDLDAPTERIVAQVSQAGATAALTTGGVTPPADLSVLTRDELDAYDGEKPKLRPVKATAPALIIPAGEELAVHSNYSLAAMSVALTAFIPDLKSFSAVSPPPLWNWEALTFALCPLLNGAPLLAAGLDELSSVEGFDPLKSYTVLLREDGDRLAGGSKPPAVLRDLHYVFVSTPYFVPNWRRGVEASRGREVLPIWGTAAFGPAVGAHPTWFPFDAHGIPLVNVRVLPVDPGSGQPSLVPWEMLESAEIGVESPGLMTGFVREGAANELLSGKILRTHISASVDHVGVVVFHKPPKHKAAA